MRIKIKRMMAAYIDAALVVFISTLLTDILTLGNFNLEAPVILQIISSILYIAIVILLFVRKDLIFKNASIGKKMLRIKIVDSQNNDIRDKKVIVNRSKETLSDFFLYPIHILTCNESSGNEKFKTKVIDNK